MTKKEVALKKEIKFLEGRIESLQNAIGFSCHLLTLGITGYRAKKGTHEECLLDNVELACKEYARLRK